MSHIKRCEIGGVGLMAPPIHEKLDSEEKKEQEFFRHLTVGLTEQDGFLAFDSCGRQAKHSMVYRHDNIGDDTKQIRRLCDLHFEAMEILTAEQQLGGVDDKTGKYHLGIRVKLRKNRL